jgi:hypothetical protein
MSDEYERAVRVERAKELMQDMATMQQEAFKVAGNHAINAGLEEALKEAGLTPADWQQIYFGQPETTMRKQKEQMKKFASKLIAKAQKGQRSPDEKPTTAPDSLRQGGQRPRGSDSKDISAIAEAQRGGKLSSDKALDAMLKSSLGDYFRRTMGE